MALCYVETVMHLQMHIRTGTESLKLVPSEFELLDPKPTRLSHSANQPAAAVSTKGLTA